GEVNSSSVNCSGFAPSGMPPRGAPFHEVGAPLQITNLKATSLASYGATLTWQTSSPSTMRVSYGVVDFGVPTAWAPAGVSGGTPTASLIGLDSGVTYRIWVRGVSDDGFR